MRLSTSLGLILLALSSQALAQAKEERPTGLPKKVQWTFNLDAGIGAFGFGNSLYTDVKPDPSGDLSDNWFESYAKPAISGTVRAGKGSFFGKVSGVGERTYAAPPPLVGSEASSFMIEDLYVGWRSGTALGAGEDALELTVGRAQYRIGHGLLLWDGGGEGGTRGGFWSNARKAWGFAGIARFHAKSNTLEGFYLDRNEVPESETGTRVAGGNYERALGSATTLGATFMSFMSDSLPQRDGMNVFNLRAYTAPLRKLPGLSFEAEYALEQNGDLRDATAWNIMGAYELSKSPWKPKLSYRYAFFQGDDPTTTPDESFDMLLPGFYDWGTWWQGEIGGEYFLSNSNLISHQLRVHVTPSEAVSAGLFAYDFRVDQPASFGPGVTSNHIAMELDAYADWKVNSNFIVSFVAALAEPKEAAEQGFGRTSTFTYGMVYVAYAY
ncbi:MAG: alginate export family protein [Gemmatimonadota bacterium]